MLLEKKEKSIDKWIASRHGFFGNGNAFLPYFFFFGFVANLGTKRKGREVRSFCNSSGFIDGHTKIKKGAELISSSKSTQKKRCKRSSKSKKKER